MESLEINSNIISTLEESSVDVGTGINFLLGVYFGYQSNYYPLEVINQIHTLSFYTLDNTGNLDWKIPLFGTVYKGFEWVQDEYIPLFKAANPVKRGNTKDCVSRMKKFFAENPAYRKDDVIGATKLYLSKTDRNFIRASHYFISKGVGTLKTSDLLTWVEDYLEGLSTTSEGVRNKLQ